MTDLPEYMDHFTQELFEELFSGVNDSPQQEIATQIDAAVQTAQSEKMTQPIVDLFSQLLECKRDLGLSPISFGLSTELLQALAKKHATVDEHGVTLGGRVAQALAIVSQANRRVEDYLEAKDREAPSGIHLWEEIQANTERIKSSLGMTDADFDSFEGQLKFAIDSVERLGKAIPLAGGVLENIARITRRYRMRLTPYYAALIRPDRINDPILLQAVPTGEMIDNTGVEIPPVAADHSPARLIDQFYPRTLTIKATNMCAMYCTHCLRIAHIGKKDRIYAGKTYAEALAYIRANKRIRDVLVTGGDALMLSNKMLRRLLTALDDIDHVQVKRLGTRIPVTAPMRIDTELLEILSQSNTRKPLRVVTQINTAQEITPLSRDAFRRLSGAASAVLNQAVLLKGINDSRVKMWQLCETIHAAYVRPYYVFNCSYRNPQFAHLRVPVERGRDIIESMYGNISGDAIPRYIATAGGKIPLHRSNVVSRDNANIVLRKPWSGEEVTYPDADAMVYAKENFSFARLKEKRSLWSK
jgi:lysine 2,3-aminomutase